MMPNRAHPFLAPVLALEPSARLGSLTQGGTQGRSICPQRRIVLESLAIPTLNLVNQPFTVAVHGAGCLERVHYARPGEVGEDALLYGHGAVPGDDGNAGLCEMAGVRVRELIGAIGISEHSYPVGELVQAVRDWSNIGCTDCIKQGDTLVGERTQALCDPMIVKPS